MEQASLDQILDASEENQDLWNDLMKTWEMVVPSPQIEINVDSNAAWNNIKSNIDSGQKINSQKSSWKLFLYVAAAISAIIISFSVWLFSSEDVIRYENTQMASIEHTLPDNSLIRLEPNSYIEFVEDFNTASREVSMTGDVFFDVEEDSKPFVIHTTLLDIKVTGTSFCVSDIKGKEVEVSVVEGTVNLINRKKRDQVLSLKKGETMKYVRTKEAFEKIEKDLNTLYPKTKRLLFNRTPLKKVCKVLEKCFDIEIQLDEKLKVKRYTGSFTNQSLDEILEVISLTLEVEIDKTDNKIKINETASI